MSKIVITLSLFFCVFTNLKAQVITEPKIKEYYFHIPLPLNFSSIPIDFEYKKQMQKNRFLKLGFFSLYSNYNNNKTVYVNNGGYTYQASTKVLSGGINVGLEFRKSLGDNLTFYHGPNISLSYYNINIKPNNGNIYDPKISKQETYSISIPYTFGLLFKINNHLLIAGQINPSVYVSQDNQTNLNQNFILNKNQSASIGFDNQLGSIAIVYRR